MSFWRELRRRNLFRVAFTYLIVAWLLIQVVNNVAAPLNLPGWTPTLVIVLLGVGFPVALVIAWAFELTPDGPRRSPERTEYVPVAATFGRKWDFVIIVGLVVALGYFVWDGQRPINGVESAAIESAGEKSLAVLPFADISPDGDQEFFSDGITEEILNSLARIDDLQVAGRTSSFYFKERAEDLRTIGEQLGVDHILEGSVRKAGEELRITTQLINAETGYHLWSETYDRTMEDVFAIQEDIARSVGDALEVTLGVGELGRMPGMTDNIDAYDAYLRGRTSYSGSGTNESYRRQIDELERAVELDPSFALAWAELARVYRIRTYLDDSANARPLRAERDVALRRARQLAPEAAAVRSELANAAAYRNDWSEAERNYREAVARHERPRLQLDFGSFLLMAGKADAAIEYLLDARRAEPLWLEVAVFLGLAYEMSGRMELALSEYDRGASIAGDQQAPVLGAVSFTAALTVDDSARLERLLAGEGGVIRQALRPFMDDPKRARAELRRLYEQTSDGRRPFLQSAFAGWAAHFRANDLALAALRESATSFGGDRVSMWRPIMSEVRMLTGFKELVRDLGLVEYWRETGWGDFCRPVGENDFECE